MEILHDLPNLDLTPKNKIKLQSALEAWLVKKANDDVSPTIADLAKYSLSPNSAIIAKLNEFGLDTFLQYIQDQEKSALEKVGIKGSGAVAKELLLNKHNLNQEGINPLEVKFVPDLKVANYQRNLIATLIKKKLLTNKDKAIKVANELLNDYALESGKRFPTQKK